MLPKALAFVDVETTGMRAIRDRIIEIGIVRVDDNAVTQTFQSLVNPQIYVPAEIEVLTGIPGEMLDKAPLFEDVSSQIHEILDGCLLVAHNVRFDYSFLKNEFRRLAIPFSIKHFCTVKLSRYLFPEHKNHNLDSIIQRFDLVCEKRHRAFDDAKILWDFYQKIGTLFPKEKLDEALKHVLKTPSLPVSLSRDDLENLPQSPGVYIFEDQNNYPLYVGKSINIANRVRSHFSQDHSNATDMKISQQIAAIKTIPTAGELGALFTESNLVKTLQPLYNRKLRQCRKLYVVKTEEDEHGYTRIIQEMVETIYPTDLKNLIGIFKSKKQIKDALISLAKTHQLCEKLLGLEKTTSGCFGYRLGWCKGACVEQENPLIYNARCIVAFSKLKIKPWPFTGPIRITEKHEDKTEQFIIDNWCYLGSITWSGQAYEKVLRNEILFDKDLYKILLSYIVSSKKQHTIRLLSKEETDRYFSTV